MTNHLVKLVRVYDAPTGRDEDGSVWCQPISDMHFANARVGWAMDQHHFLRTVDGGRTWIKRLWNRRDWPYSFPHLHALSAKTCWIAARFSQTSVRCCFTQDGGETWHAKEFDPEMHPRDLFFIDSKRGWLTSDNGEWPAGEGRVHITHDGGKTWLASQTQIARSPDRVRFHNALQGWLIEHYWNSKSEPYTRLHTTIDGGNSWRRISTFRRALYDLRSLDEKRVIAVGDTGFIGQSLDGGESWRRIKTRTLANINAVEFYDHRIGLALGDWNRLFLTINGGEDWEQLKPPYDAGNFIGTHFTSSR